MMGKAFFCGIVLGFFHLTWSQCETQMPASSDFQTSTPVNLSGNSDFSGGTHLMEMAFASDGRLFFVVRQGQVGLLENGTLRKIHTIDAWDQQAALNTGAQGLESGVRGMTLDPNFDENGWIYIAYDENKTRQAFLNKQELTTKIVRFTYRDATKTIDASTEKTILSFISNGVDHVSGSLTFGPGGVLHYLSGDDTDSQSFNQFAPLNWAPDVGGNNACRKFDDNGNRVPGGDIPSFSPCVSDASRSTANTNDLRGKTLRIIPIAFGDDQTPAPGENSTYTIPEGNLFVDDDPLTRSEIYTMGHRAGWRLTVDPVEGWVFIGEGGPASTTLNSNGSPRGPYGHEEYNIAAEPGFFGWPYFNADSRPYRPWNFSTNQPTGDFFDPDSPVENESPRNTGASMLPVTKDATIYHSRRGISGIPNGTSASHSYFNDITGCVPMPGPRYYYGLHNRSTGTTTKLPPYFDKKWFITDVAGGFLGVATLNQNQSTGAVNVTDIEDFPFPGNFWGGNILDFEIDPDGALYFAVNNQIRKVAYTGSCRPPDEPYVNMVAKGVPSKLLPQKMSFSQQVIQIPSGKGQVHLFNLKGELVWSSKSVSAASSREVQVPESLKDNLYYLQYE